MYKSKYANLMQHLMNEHDLILLDSEQQEIEKWVDMDLKEQCNIPVVVRSGNVDSINAEFTKARKDFAKACNNYLNSKEHKAMIEAFKKVGAID